ncbi:uncharacterized protein LOC26527965 [Drosophila mojavensis]|uniref:Uncharacterized protein n=1 Tax=Drosophila mojavensis TaxID=7230 RepID=A0A0Q9XEC4_DROMO|nr:uncharacterized protein LOC26527965 [Drosophila mojavensis]KRG02577.1 uncharacterized protein Dmoj_GI26324 [Drosophila mojavensis]
MAEVQQVNIQCECPHHHGPLFLLKPWAWGRPCRRCQRMMERNVVVVPTQGAAAVSVTPALTNRSSPVVVSTTTTQTVPGLQVQQVQQVQQVVTTQQTLSPAYNETLVIS